MADDVVLYKLWTVNEEGQREYHFATFAVKEDAQLVARTMNLTDNDCIMTSHHPEDKEEL